MSDNKNSFQTIIIGDNNPKAVFIGEKNSLADDIAKYLHEASVDLYSGNKPEDALFGNYFFYFDKEENVKSFLDKNIFNLPRGLVILPTASGILTDIINRKNHQVKLLLIDYLFKPTADDIKIIFDFFFSSSKKILQHKSSLPLVTKPAAGVTTKKEEDCTDSADKTGNTNLQHDNGVNYLRKNTLNKPVLADKTDTVREKIKNLYKPEKKLQNVKSQKILPKTKFHKLFLVSLIILFACLILPFFLLTASSFFGFWQISQIEKNIRLNKNQTVPFKIKTAQTAFTTAEKSLSMTFPVFDILKQRELYNQAGKIIDISQRFLKGSDYLFKIQTDLESLFSGISGKQTEYNLNFLTSRIKGNLILSDAQLALAEAQRKTPEVINFWNRPQLKIFKPKYEDFSNIITETRQAILIAKNGLVILPEAISQENNRKYLVIFQNNMELRPTGGFIGSFALIDFKKGSLQKINIEDVYAADGSLLGHVDPPEPIKTYLGQEHWYLRDSNWDPDFAKSARQIMWFLEKELDEKVDGVIAVDLTAAQYLLEVTGQIKITDFDLVVSAADLFKIAQKEAQSDFFPGSTKKKDFLGALGKEMIGELLQNDSISSIKLFQKIYTAIKEKHIQFYFTDQSLQEYTHQNNWDGGMSFVANCGPDCIVDYFAMTEANLGVNKTNYFLKRSFSDEVKIENDGRIHHQLTVKYQNDSPQDDLLLGGDYKNYFRLYLPNNTKLLRAEADRLPLNIVTGKIASATGVLAQTKDGFYIIEGLIEIKPQTQKTLTLIYDRRDVFEPDILPKKLSYTIRKQPGTLTDPVLIKISYPPNWQIQTPVASKNTLVKNGSIEYNTTLREDLKLNYYYK